MRRSAFQLTRACRRGLIAAIIAASFVGRADAQQLLMHGALRDLPAVAVQIVSPTTLSTANLKSTVELALRRSGIRVIQASEFRDNPTAGGLLVQIAASEQEGLFGGIVTLELYQFARLVRDPTIMGAVVTWRSGGPFVASADRVDRVVENSVRSELEHLVNDYLASNQE